MGIGAIRIMGTTMGTATGTIAGTATDTTMGTMGTSNGVGR
jgi:hypothetical protein